MHQFIIQSEISRRERERKKERKKRWVFHETSVYTHIVALLHASHRLSAIDFASPGRSLPPPPSRSTTSNCMSPKTGPMHLCQRGRSRWMGTMSRSFEMGRKWRNVYGCT